MDVVSPAPARSPEMPTAQPPAAPKAFEATRTNDGTGTVFKGAALTVGQAVARRQQGFDVVACGPNAMANYRLAATVESHVGPAREEKAHLRSAGPRALRHFYQAGRYPPGHTFYEQPPTRTAV